MTQAINTLPPLDRRVNRAFDVLSSFGIALAGTFAITISTAFYESFNSVRLGPAILLLTVLHLMRYPSIFFGREALAYVLFVAYMLIELLWTPNVTLAINTLVPAANFAFILILFGSLVAFHDTRSVLLGMLAGIILGALVYSAATGFPTVRPAGFSYNGIAAIYLSGLFTTLALASHTRFSAALALLALVFLLLVVSTTSIKSTLGIALGCVATSVFYFRHMAKGLKRSAFALTVLIFLIGYLVVSNDALFERVEAGVNRIALGVEILQSREDRPGYSGFAKRSNWLELGVNGWLLNPVFGHGVEGFRSRYNMTSHATPIDLLYNSGLVGFILFYSMFGSLVLRLIRLRDNGLAHVAVVVFAAVVCYSSITLSGTMHYNTFLAIFIGTSAALLGKRRGDSVMKDSRGDSA